MANKITTIEMEEAVARFFGYRQNIIVPNVSWGFHIHECDLLVLRKSGHLLEIEIKISKSDLKKDLEKRHEHVDYYDRVREFWFAVPEELLDSIDYIPERAGIIMVYMNEWINEYCCKTVRDPKVNSKAVKLCENEQLMLARLGTMRIWGLKRKIIHSKKRKIIQRNKFKEQLKLAI
jgi:hypothetical protein